MSAVGGPLGHSGGYRGAVAVTGIDLRVKLIELTVGRGQPREGVGDSFSKVPTESG